MNKKYLIYGMVASLILLILIILFTRGSEESNGDSNVVLPLEKQDFFIDLVNGKDFGNNSFLEKIGKVISQEDIQMNAQANGKIASIYVKEGQKIVAGQKLISLTDSIGSYGLNLEKANLGVESSKIDYSSQKVNLDKAVDDALINLERTQNDYDNTSKTLEQNLIQSQLNLDSSKNIEEDTTLALQLQKLKNNLNKATLDVENIKNTNIEQLRSFKNSALSTYDTLDNLMIDIIDFSDQLLGITPLNKSLNDKYEDFLGRKDRLQLSETEQLFRDFVGFKEEKFDILDLEGIDFEEMTLDDYEEVFSVGDEGYDMAKKFLKELTKVLDNSLVSVSSLSQNDIDAKKSQINGFESQTLQNYSAYLSFKSSVRTFINTYKNNENSAEENLKLLEDEVKILEKNKQISDTDFGTALRNNEINFEKTKIDTEKNLKNLEISLKNAKLVYENAKKVRDVTLRKMNNAIKISQNSSSQAYKEYAKLSLKSSIYGVVTDIFVDVGQDVNIGTPIAKISSLSNTEAEISLSENELNFVKVGEKIEVDYLGNMVSGTVESVSPVADENLMYKTKITFDQKFTSIGGLIDIKIPVKTDKVLVPINIIEVTGEAQGMLKTMSGGVLTNYKVNLGKVWGDKIEVLSDLPSELQVITTNISNYDEAKFELKVKEKEGVKDIILENQ